MLKMKEQAKNSQEQPNEEEAGNLPKKEFRVTIVIMISKILGKKWGNLNTTPKIVIKSQENKRERE